MSKSRKQRHHKEQSRGGLVSVEVWVPRSKVRDLRIRADQLREAGRTHSRAPEPFQHSPGEKWARCVFEGLPPEPFSTWEEFLDSPLKFGVTLRATDKEQAAC